MGLWLDIYITVPGCHLNCQTMARLSTLNSPGQLMDQMSSNIQGEADHPSAMYCDHTEFDRGPKPTVFFKYVCILESFIIFYTIS